jgi:hypothetical protein
LLSIVFLQQFANGSPEYSFLIFGQVILLILAENQQQKDLPIPLNEIVEISEAAALPLAPARVGCPGLSDPARAFHDFSTSRALQEIIMYFQKHVISVLPGKRRKALRENGQFYKH